MSSTRRPTCHFQAEARVAGTESLELSSPLHVTKTVQDGGCSITRIPDDRERTLRPASLRGRVARARTPSSFWARETMGQFVE